MAVPADDLVTPAGSAHDGRPSLLARYGTLTHVRRAIETLEAQGIDGDHLTLVGREGELPRHRASSGGFPVPRTRCSGWPPA